MKIGELVHYLDELLDNDTFTFDDAINGLQVGNIGDEREIKKIGYAVDASLKTLQNAKDHEVDLIICHHGVFWGRETPLIGVHYDKMSILLNNKIFLYASHLPLDAHKEVGNNIGLLRAWENCIGLQDGEGIIHPVGKYNDQNIGFGIKWKRPVHIGVVQSLFCDAVGLKKKLFHFGKKEYITSIAFVSGSGGKSLQEIHNSEYDIFVTGEMQHYEIIAAQELSQSVLLGGHWETEKIGPKLLAYSLQKKIGCEILFIDSGL